MTMIGVESSDLRSVGYDAATSRLAIEFKSGGTYEYFDVPQQVFTGLLSADSKGKYFHANIRERFRYHKIG